MKGALAACGALTYKPGFGKGAKALGDATEVKRVLVMFKCHLDAGFTDGCTRGGAWGAVAYFLFHRST